MINPLQLSYAAGLIDGEGCISIACHHSDKRISYDPFVRVNMTDEAPIRFLADTFGGPYFKYVHKKPNRRPSYIWARAGSNAIKVCELLVPYLLLKLPNALNILEFGENFSKRDFSKGRQKPMAPEEQKRREALWTKAKQLNHRD